MNRIFSGFIPLNWKSKGDNTYDKSSWTFIFSLNLNEKYDMIQYYLNRRPIFVEHD